MNLAELALALGAECHGDGDGTITGVAGLEEAGPGDVTFVANPRYSALARTTNPTAVIGKNAHIGACAVVSEGVTIGDHATLLPHVVIYPHVTIGDHFFAHAHSIVREHCRVGDNVVLQNGAVIGCDGFGFAKDDAGVWHKIVQSGPAIIEDS